MILKEFQTYVRNGEGSFVTATIQAIGRCAATMPTLTEQCLRGLMVLMSNANEDVVAESVVVMRNLLQARFLPTASTACSTLPYPTGCMLPRTARPLLVSLAAEARVCLIILSRTDTVQTTCSSTTRRASHLHAETAGMAWHGMAVCATVFACPRR